MCGFDSLSSPITLFKTKKMLFSVCLFIVTKKKTITNVVDIYNSANSKVIMANNGFSPMGGVEIYDNTNNEVAMAINSSLIL